MAKATETTPKEVAEAKNSLYELMLILSPELRESEVKKKLKELVEMVEKAGGRVTEEDFWGRRKLAYPIKKNKEGIYTIYNLELPASLIDELKEHLRIEKDILRSMLLSLPAGYVYTKYDLETAEKSKERPEKPKKSVSDGKKNISIKHNAPIVPPKKKEEAPAEESASDDAAEAKSDAEGATEPSQEKKADFESDAEKEKTQKKEEKEEKKTEDKKKEKEIDEAELDKKLDAIIGGEDLNL